MTALLSRTPIALATAAGAAKIQRTARGMRSRLEGTRGCSQAGMTWCG
jgi:hypothetical protein